MNFLNRTLQLYLLLLAGISTTVAVWGTNRFILENTTAVTGWGVVVGIAVLLVAIGLVVRYFISPTDEDPLTEEYPW